MSISIENLETLSTIQQIDLKMRKVEKDLENLPQRNLIVQAREKAAELTKKREQLTALARQTQEKVTRKVGEQEIAQTKITQVEAEIAAAEGDYRRIANKTKELDSLVKRLAIQKEEEAGFAEELAKIEALLEQVQSALDKTKADEDAATASFVKEGTALKQALALAERKKEDLAQTIPSDLFAQYEKIANRTGGVALAMLKGQACGACRATIEQGRLVALRSQGNVALCPHCGRLLVLHEHRKD